MQPSRLSARGKPPEANNWEAGSLRLCDGHSQVSRLHLGTVLSPGTPRREAFPRKEMAFLLLWIRWREGGSRSRIRGQVTHPMGVGD